MTTEAKDKTDRREIKFRAWDSTLKYMITPYCELRDGKFWGEDCTNNPFSIAHEHVMQYTGLKDKNGKEIWEGDIIELFWPFAGASYFTKVIWVNESARFAMEEIRADGRGLYHYFDSQDTKRMNVEVIGNIYENPELLNHDERI